MRRTTIILTALTFGIIGCGGSSGGYSTGPSNPGSGTGTGTPPEANTVTLTSDLTFSPGTMSVSKGTTVTWKWTPCSDTGYGGYGSCASHSVSFDDGTTSPTQTEGSYTRTFNATGTFKYHCAVHGTAMAGEITVK